MNIIVSEVTSVCSLILSVVAVAGLIVTAIKRAKSPNVLQNERLDALENRVKRHDELFLNEWRKMILKDAERELKNRVAPETFQAYELYAVQNRPVEKVAAYLDCSVNQVYQAKKRCFAMMREILLKMNRCILENKAAGLYNGAYAVVKLAVEKH